MTSAAQPATELDSEEQAIVDTVARLRRRRGPAGRRASWSTPTPTRSELIEQMKELGVFGLADPRAVRRRRTCPTPLLRRASPRSSPAGG